MVLGIFGLGSAWRYAATLGYGPGWLGESLIFLGLALCAIVARRVCVGGHDAGILLADGGR